MAHKMTCEELSRFAKKWVLNIETGCWDWRAYRTVNGYGQIKTNGKVRFAHRVSYEQYVGEIPSGLHIDHLCRNRSCVNPSHLEAVTQRENTLRGVGATAKNATKTHCPRGHVLAGLNLVPSYLKQGRRVCLTCEKVRWTKYKLSTKDRAREYMRKRLELNRSEINRRRRELYATKYKLEK